MNIVKKIPLEKGDWILMGLAVLVFFAAGMALEFRVDWLVFILLFVEVFLLGCLLLRFTSWVSEFKMVKRFGNWVARM